MLDTNVVVAAMRSPRGASAGLLRACRRDEVTLIANVALALEYEAVCRRPEHREAAEFSQEDVSVFVDAVIAMMEPTPTWFLWRPQLRDPGDELVLEAAVNGRSDAIATFNLRDFGSAPDQFGIQLLSPAEAIKRIKP